jgi:hypothetical protein
MAQLPRDFGYFLYIAASSAILVPILEEIFVRGYVLTRFESVFGAATAIILSALLFSLSHGQYLTGDLFGVGISICMIWSSLLWAYVAYRTRSLVPAIVAHALLNSPLSGRDSPELIGAVALVVCLIFARSIARGFADFASLFRHSGFSLAQFGAGTVLIVAWLMSVSLFGDRASVVLAAAFVAIAIATRFIQRNNQ